MAKLMRTDEVISYDELANRLCWDDDDDPVDTLRNGRVDVCGGRWRREKGNRWRFYEDPEVAAELAAIPT